tara:strand:- start:1197 stop:2690 length:1494 start_codon:yes stop_codon:yes gene_type:complete
MQQFDVVILGAGFGGSLTALLLDRIGFSVALIDRGSHPRFAIGESSTPIAGYLLQSLSEQYDLPQFQPFCKYGSWQQSYPGLACGIKRGFSYFSQEPHQSFQAQPDHGSELLVTANLSDALADTHWYRAAVDCFFADEVKKSKVVYLDQTEVSVNRSHVWEITGVRTGEQIALQAAFLIDATGAVGIVPYALGIKRQTEFLTNSTAIYGHFEKVTPWAKVLDRCHVSRSDYPFDCDHSALHHVLSEGWMWQLRFNNGITSAGFVLAGEQKVESTEQCWRQLLERYPAIASQFEGASLVAPETGLVSTGRLQRGWKMCAGADWALLPHTAGFIDPLHSTGIAHTLCGIERLVAALEKSWGKNALPQAMSDYSNSVQTELALIDALVAGCYRNLSQFNLFAASTMFYFAAATRFEHLRCREGEKPLFLCADDADFRYVTRAWFSRDPSIQQQTYCDSAKISQAIVDAEILLKPWNQVGLFHPPVPNMYYYTAAPDSEPR